MAEELRVDPVDLHLSADHMSVHHANLRAAHAGADSDIDSAQAGCVGASAAALQAKLAEWQEATEQLCGSIAEHEQGFRVAGRQYTAADEASAGHITGDI
ncbi:WXG100 family type VII secretion target [Mycobacterium sp.]|uniref:WXG100 family type VII secretion target n=1 Tax=Mycobacterium sp. TaxID=1785 RepID=UPI0031E47724